MSSKRIIRAADVVADIRARKTDLQLMEKYRLSPEGLQRVMKKLLDARLITLPQYDWRPTGYDDTVVLDLERPDH
jgi:hypothetical protein